MITRDVNQLFVVPALVHNARFHSCTVTGFTCYGVGAGVSGLGTSELFPGFIIDRLGLPRHFNSLMVAPVIYGDIATSGDGAVCINSLTAGVMHASASGGTFAAYSTDNWFFEKALWRQSTATSTAHGSFTQVQRDVGLTTEIGIGGLTGSATSTAAGVAGQDMVAGTTSTGFLYYAGAGPVFDLGGAKRFIKVTMRTKFETTGCGSGGYHMSAAAIFGEPDEARPPFAPGKRILVTSGCAT